MVADELRGLSDSELSEHVRDLREQLFKLRFQKSTGQAESAARLKKTRRDLARAQTIQRQRQLQQDRTGNDAAAAR